MERQFQILRLWAGFGIVGYLPLELRRAGEDDHDAIVSLIDAAAQWLRATKDTDQWTQPWRNEEDRSNRIRRDLTAGKTWLLHDSGLAVATITADPADYPIWPAERQREPAVYVRRLVVRRDHAGRRLGTTLLDWAGLTAREAYGAAWIRVDVWRTNKELHDYYEDQGFRSCGEWRDPAYPSGALFQKPTEHLREPLSPLFHEA
jgi:GNAT superfamily N-acetyltransferase